LGPLDCQWDWNPFECRPPGFECIRLLGINLGTVFLARETATGGRR